MAWVLIIIIFGNGNTGKSGSGVATQEFSSKERCLEAAEIVSREDYNWHKVKAVCAER
jgi:hypothetical protein